MNQVFEVIKPQPFGRSGRGASSGSAIVGGSSEFSSISAFRPSDRRQQQFVPVSCGVQLSQKCSRLRIADFPIRAKKKKRIPVLT